MSTSSLSATFYAAAVKNHSNSAMDNLRSQDGWFSHQADDRKVLTILKNIAYKTSMAGLVVLGSIELVAKTALSLVAYGFSLISTPIEWTIKTPYSLIKNKQMPDLSISNKIYSFGNDLLGDQNVRPVYCSLYNLFFDRNRLTQGVV